MNPKLIWGDTVYSSMASYIDITPSVTPPATATSQLTLILPVKGVPIFNSARNEHELSYLISIVRYKWHSCTVYMQTLLCQMSNCEIFQTLFQPTTIVWM